MEKGEWDPPEDLETMEEEQQFTCPYCWQTVEIRLDLSAGGQVFIQDCEVCCNPLEFRYEVQDGAIRHLEVSGLDQ